MNDTIKHLVMYSGGICSWAAALRVVERKLWDEWDGMAVMEIQGVVVDERRVMNELLRRGEPVDL